MFVQNSGAALQAPRFRRPSIASVRRCIALSALGVLLMACTPDEEMPTLGVSVRDLEARLAESHSILGNGVPITVGSITSGPCETGHPFFVAWRERDETFVEDDFCAWEGVWTVLNERGQAFDFKLGVGQDAARENVVALSLTGDGGTPLTANYFIASVVGLAHAVSDNDLASSQNFAYDRLVRPAAEAIDPTSISFQTFCRIEDDLTFLLHVWDNNRISFVGLSIDNIQSMKVKGWDSESCVSG